LIRASLSRARFEPRKLEPLELLPGNIQNDKQAELASQGAAVHQPISKAV
jgi:hypothetical protein